MPWVTSIRDANSPRKFAAYAGYQLHSSVIDDIYLSVIFLTGWSAMVTCIELLTPHSVAVNNSLLSILAGLLSFVISLRTSSAFERFSEGRKLWADINLSSRQLAGFILWHVDDAPGLPNEAGEITPLAKEKAAIKSAIEKRTILRLIEAFSPALKHYLRSEGGILYDDLYHLVALLPTVGQQQFPVATGFENRGPGPNQRTPTESSEAFDSQKGSPATTFRAGPDLEKAAQRPDLRRGLSSVPLKPGHCPPNMTFFDVFPVFLVFRPFFHWLFRRAEASFEDQEARDARRRRKQLRALQVESNLPLDILLYLSSYSASIFKRGLIAPAVFSSLLAPINSLQVSLVGLERIVSTPLPYGYSLHLKLVAWLWLILANVPFQLVAQMGWLTIPGIAISATFFLGFLSLGDALEQPCGYDSTDLDLDHLAELTSRELSEIAAHPGYDADTFINAPLNAPFFPEDPRCAADIVSQVNDAQTLRQLHCDHYAHVNSVFAARRNARQRGRPQPQYSREPSVEALDIV